MKITSFVENFCRSICPDATPEYVTVSPSPGGVVSECFNNVERVVCEMGGHRVFGWNIWLWPQVLIEAEFHAIWEDENGARLDITPHNGGEKKILFVEDPLASYDGTVTCNIRKPLSQDQLVVDFVDISDAFNKIYAELYQGPGDHISFENPLHLQIIDVKSVLGGGIKYGKNERSKCFCNSGQKYGRCCHPRIRELLRAVASA